MAEKRYINPNADFFILALPRWLARRRDVTDEQKMVYADIATFGFKGVSRPGEERIADDVGYRQETVHDAIIQLQNHGLIEVEQDGKTVRYRFLLKEEWIRPGDYKRKQQVRSNTQTPHNNYYNNNIIIRDNEDSVPAETIGVSPQAPTSQTNHEKLNGHTVQEIVDCFKQFYEAKYSRPYVSEAGEQANAEILLRYCVEENLNDPIEHFHTRLTSIAKKVSIKRLIDVIINWRYDIRTI